MRTILAVLLVLWAALSPALGQRASPVEDGTVAIKRKLDRIVIPSLEFRGTSVADALEFLRQESRRLDPDPNPDARGVNLFLRVPVDGVPAASPRITVSLSRVPLLVAVRYVANLAGLKVKVEPYAVAVVPLSENTEPMVTATFRVPAGFIGNAGAPAPPP